MWVDGGAQRINFNDKDDNCCKHLDDGSSFVVKAYKPRDSYSGDYTVTPSTGGEDLILGRSDIRARLVTDLLDIPFSSEQHLFLTPPEQHDAAAFAAAKAREDAAAREAARKYREAQAAIRAEQERRLAMPPPAIGMTASQVRDATSWGAPARINETITAAGRREQWVYSTSRLLYFDNGKLTAIEQSR